MNVFEEFNITKRNHGANFTNELKTNLINVISKKTGLSLNANKILPKMKIKRV